MLWVDRGCLQDSEKRNSKGSDDTGVNRAIESIL